MTHLKGEPRKMKLTNLFLALSVAAAPVLKAQQPAAPVKLPPFDIISVKVNNSGSRNTSMGSNADSLYVTNVPIQLILKQAFFINDDQIVGSPDWVKFTRFDINAKIAGPDLDAFNHLANDQRKLMIVQILTDRFHLAWHRETPTLPEYALVVAKGGPKFQPTKPGDDDAGHPKHSSMSIHDGVVTAQNLTLAPLVHFLADRLQGKRTEFRGRRVAVQLEHRSQRGPVIIELAGHGAV